MEKLKAKKDGSTKVKVVLKCGRKSMAGYAGDGCGNCGSNTNNSGQAVCC